jgi:group I intron endonuclease
MKSGVYKIRNLVNGRLYVGSSKDIQVRWAEHRTDLRKGVHVNPHLQRAWNKYGEGSFAFEFIERTKAKRLIEREQHWMDFHDVVKTGYNVLPSARPGRRGLKHTAEARAKMSAAKRAYWSGLSPSERSDATSHLNRGGPGRPWTPAGRINFRIAIEQRRRSLPERQTARKAQLRADDIPRIKAHSPA